MMQSSILSLVLGLFVGLRCYSHWQSHVRSGGISLVKNCTFTVEFTEVSQSWPEFLNVFNCNLPLPLYFTHSLQHSALPIVI